MADIDDGGVPLTGLDGSNLLGFLAALGTLRTLALADPDDEWEMKWDTPHGGWIPILRCRSRIGLDVVVNRLFAGLKRDSTPEFDLNRDPEVKNLSVDPLTFREVSGEAQTLAIPARRGYADFIAAYGSDSCVAKDGKKIEDTALRTMSGSGNQHFLGTMKQLASQTEESHLREALFGPWSYSDKKLGLRWDTQEDRRYALRWDNPSDGHGVKTVRGANRLAVEALPLFPAVPGVGGLETTGFVRRDKRVFLTWPLWTPPASAATVRSLLALPELRQPELHRQSLHARGVVEVFQCERITVERKINFTLARAI